MKANNGKGNNPSRDEWETPSWIIDPLMQQYNFEFDCCATKENKKAERFSEGGFQDIKIVEEIAWMNPPFSKAYAMFRHFFKVVKKGIAIYRGDNLETALWQKEILPNCSWILIPDRRVSYEGLDGDGARFPSILIGIGVEVPRSIKGIILEVKADGTTTDGIPSKTKVSGILPNEL